MGDQKPPGAKKLAALLGDGLSALEYAVIAALVALVVIAIVSPLGPNVGKLFTAVPGAIEAQPFFCRDDCAANSRGPRLKEDTLSVPRPCSKGGRCS